MIEQSWPLTSPEQTKAQNESCRRHGGYDFVGAESQGLQFVQVRV
ncbi:hypothetical protein ACIOG3_08825 [Yersinia rochesterensis]|nr:MULTISPECIES: hypothetical protein [Yersinia]MDA5542781.1 hypothetical protein [Yersinia rochesterensis]MDN0105686.1 hypothetical protein [Yersinia rochesterensis]UZM76642.1 hypothetical protein OP863_08555 [Yersinia sp. SCPM-O-B-9106 (C-191)]